jgi:hypothetical protein
MGASLYGVNLFLDRVLGSGDPATLWVAALYEQAGYLDTGETLNEPDGNGYARAEMPNNDAYWQDASDGYIANRLSVVFPQATGTWGVIRAFALTDHPTAGNLIGGGPITSRRVLTGATLRFPQDALAINLR